MVTGKFKEILIRLVENTRPKILKVAVKTDTEVKSGNLYYDLIDYKQKVGEREYGFITPEGKYLTRKDSLA